MSFVTAYLSPEEKATIRAHCENPLDCCPYFRECKDALMASESEELPLCIGFSDTGFSYKELINDFLKTLDKAESMDARDAIRRFISNGTPIACNLRVAFEYAFYELQFKEYVEELVEYEKARKSKEFKASRTRLYKTLRTYSVSLDREYICIKQLENIRQMLLDKRALTKMIMEASSALQEIEKYQKKVEAVDTAKGFWRNAQTVRLVLQLPVPSGEKANEWWESCSALIGAAIQTITKKPLDKKLRMSISPDALRQRTIRYGPDHFRQKKSESKALMVNILRRIDYPEAREALYLGPANTAVLSERSAMILRLSRAYQDGEIKVRRVSEDKASES